MSGLVFIKTGLCNVGLNELRCVFVSVIGAIANHQFFSRLMMTDKPAEH